MDNNEDDSPYPCVWHGGPFIKVYRFDGEIEYEPDYTSRVQVQRDFYYGLENNDGVWRITSRDDMKEKLEASGFVVERILTNRVQVRSWLRQEQNDKTRCDTNERQIQQKSVDKKHPNSSQKHHVDDSSDGSPENVVHKKHKGNNRPPATSK